MRIVILTAAAFLCCLNTPASAQAGSASTQVVRSFIDAFNAHDVDAMLSIAADDIRWMSISGSTLSAEATGKTELGEAMRRYFQQFSTARSIVRSVSAEGRFVTTIEQAQWVVKSESRNQCGVAVYEVDGAKIKNVWYFPPLPCSDGQ
jgi:hypothetical protein